MPWIQIILWSVFEFNIYFVLFSEIVAVERNNSRATLLCFIECSFLPISTKTYCFQFNHLTFRFGNRNFIEIVYFTNQTISISFFSPVSDQQIYWHCCIICSHRIIPLNWILWANAQWAFTNLCPSKHFTTFSKFRAH